MREVFRSSSYFLVYSRSNSSDSLRYTAKKSARELSDLSGSKNSFKAEWRLERRCYFVSTESVVTERGQLTISDQAGRPQALVLAFCVGADDR
jgi:hypothetical protein